MLPPRKRSDIVLVTAPTRILFFTGKGGVGKTSSACATAIALADAGQRVLLVSTDPASNLDEVLGVELTATPTQVPEVPGLMALNIDPEAAAHAYRERILAPYRGKLPAVAIASIEEQLSGACTVEIAAFDEFTLLLGDPAATAAYDHVIFDTAPTGHTLRLLELPAAWTNFIDDNAGGASCLGPLSGLKAQQGLYASSKAALADPAQTTLILVARADVASLKEAERTRQELATIGMQNIRLLLNGLFTATDRTDPIALALEARGTAAIASMPTDLAHVPREELRLLPFELLGIDALRRLGHPDQPYALPLEIDRSPIATEHLDSLVEELARRGHGVILTMGKGGVGKTTIAARIAMALADRGYATTLTTTDPAAHVAAAIEHDHAHLTVTRVDPEAETKRYSDAVLATAGASLDEGGRALLAEELRSPCTTEIAVFTALAATVAEGEHRFVVIDTAPTGHTLLLLDAAESYHREVLRKPSGATADVRQLLPRLRDPAFTSVILVTLPEATPIHEAMQLERDLMRAEIHPFAWLINQSLTPLSVTDPLLRSRKSAEAQRIREVVSGDRRVVLEAWTDGSPGTATRPAAMLHTVGPAS